ncbi:hypothetical protein TNCV_1379651 [Trichonephila clavipes]|nr:hypothetical protein TNCV_1379651 [Trichonephila clavipes]
MFLRTTAENFPMFSALRKVCGRPERSLSLTISLLSLERRCHSNSSVRDNVSHAVNMLQRFVSLRSTLFQANTKFDIILCSTKAISFYRRLLNASTYKIRSHGKPPTT